MKITVTGVSVTDQAKALTFYTEVLGLEKNKDIPMGEHRWLTVVSPEGAHGVELLLEPVAFPPAVEYQKALFAAGIPATMFETADFEGEVERLKQKGVVFKGEPIKMDNSISIFFEDTVGNYICLTQVTE